MSQLPVPFRSRTGWPSTRPAAFGSQTTRQALCSSSASYSCANRGLRHRTPPCLRGLQGPGGPRHWAVAARIGDGKLFRGPRYARRALEVYPDLQLLRFLGRETMRKSELPKMTGLAHGPNRAYCVRFRAVPSRSLARTGSLGPGTAWSSTGRLPARPPLDSHCEYKAVCRRHWRHHGAGGPSHRYQRSPRMVIFGDCLACLSATLKCCALKGRSSGNSLE